MIIHIEDITTQLDIVMKRLLHIIQTEVEFTKKLISIESGSRNHYKVGKSEVNKDYKPNRRNTAVVQNSRRDNSSESNSLSRRSKKSSNTNNNNASTRTVSNTRPVISSKPAANARPSVNTTKRNTNQHSRNSNTNKASKYVNNINGSKRIASNSSEKSAGNRKMIASRNIIKKRGRGL